MSSRYDISIIIPTYRPGNLIRTLDYINRQSIAGISFEIVMIQESDDGFESFYNIDVRPNMTILRQRFQDDMGASARDLGIVAAKGSYLVFWDDDNLYFPHALMAYYLTTVNHDIGIVRAYHQHLIIPTENSWGLSIEAGDIDSMCFCVSKEMAIRHKWNDQITSGRYGDFRWISKVFGTATKVNWSKAIIGRHI